MTKSYQTKSFKKSEIRLKKSNKKNKKNDKLLL